MGNSHRRTQRTQRNHYVLRCPAVANNLHISCRFKPVRADHVNFTSIALPAVDLLVENPAGKKSVALLGASGFFFHRPFLRAPEKRVKNSVLAGKNEGPKMRFTLAQEREWNPIRVVQFAPLQASVLGLVGV